MIKDVNKLFLIIFFSLISLSSYAEINFEEILENPTDLKLNLDYARQQEIKGNYKSTISALERLNLLYPASNEIKLYLLSILVKIDSPPRVQLLIEQIKNDPNATAEIKDYALDVEKSLNLQSIAKGKKKYGWYVSADTGYFTKEFTNMTGYTKTGLQFIHGTLTEPAVEQIINPMKYDKTYTWSQSLNVGKQIDDTSSFNVNLTGNLTAQNKGVQDKKDIASGSVSYTKLFKSFVITPYLSYSNYDYFNATDFATKAIGANISYVVDDKSSVGIAQSFSSTGYNRDSKWNEASSSDKNNNITSTTLSYNYALTDKDVLTTNISYTDKHASKRRNYHSSETYGGTVSYTRLLPFGALKLTRSMQNETFDGRDPFVNKNVDRINNRSISSGALSGQVIKVFPFLEKFDPEGLLFYTLSKQRVNTRGNLLNDDAIRKYTYYGLTKRFNWNE